jgi:RNA-directed DNA polymerase
MGPNSINIRTYAHLAQRLGIREGWLHHVADNMPRHVSGFDKRKKTGGTRRVYRPSEDLKLVQRRINTRLLQPLRLPYWFHGSVIGRSPKTNALPHVGKPVVAKLDIRDFYPSIHFERVASLYKDLGCSSAVAGLLTRLTTHEGHLAQGFPTSSSIANLILAEIAPRIEAVCRKHGMIPTLYQDDLNVSGGERVTGFLGLLARIFREHGLKPHSDETSGKKQVMRSTGRQTVTGLVVNRKINVPKKEYRQLRALLHRWETCGFEAVTDEPETRFRNRVRGCIQHVMDANPVRGGKLLEGFRRL